MMINVTDTVDQKDIDISPIETLIESIEADGLVSRADVLTIESCSQVVVPKTIANQCGTIRSSHGARELVDYVRSIAKPPVTYRELRIALLRKLRVYAEPGWQQHRIEQLSADKDIVKSLYIPRQLKFTLNCDCNALGDVLIKQITPETVGTYYNDVGVHTLACIKSEGIATGTLLPNLLVAGIEKYGGADVSVVTEAYRLHGDMTLSDYIDTVLGSLYTVKITNVESAIVNIQNAMHYNELYALDGRDSWNNTAATRAMEMLHERSVLHT